jgi:hypothetical protein
MGSHSRLLACALIVAACDLHVSNPSVIDATDFDPAADAGALSLSAQTSFWDAYANVVNYGAYLSGELWVGAVRQETNDFGRRVIGAGNLDLNPALWAPLSLAIASNERVLRLLDGARDINYARSAMNSAFALELMAEHFCVGVMLVGPPMTLVQTMDSAIVRFERAIATAIALTGAEPARIANASRVGLARTRLQKGDYTEAAEIASAVPAAFVHSAIYVDDLTWRGRVANGVYQSTASNTQVVAAAYRALDDPRISFTDLARKAQDGTLQLIVQTKYTGFASPIRIASGLEAAYIVAEARLRLGDSSPALALIAERRSAAALPPFAGTTQPAILAALMDQRSRDFWLEAKHLGDYMRNPAATPHVPPAGSAFYKPAQGVFAPLLCLPIPNEELRTNPHFH